MKNYANEIKYKSKKFKIIKEAKAINFLIHFQNGTLLI